MTDCLHVFPGYFQKELLQFREGIDTFDYNALGEMLNYQKDQRDTANTNLNAFLANAVQGVIGSVAGAHLDGSGNFSGTIVNDPTKLFLFGIVGVVVNLVNKQTSRGIFAIRDKVASQGIFPTGQDEASSAEVGYASATIVSPYNQVQVTVTNTGGLVSSETINIYYSLFYLNV